MLPIRRRTLTAGLAAALLGRALPLEAQEVLGETGIKGAGSTLVYPLLAKWSVLYREWQAKGGEYPAPNAGLDDPPATTALEYEPVGSLAGVLRVKERAVDFGVTDMPLPPGELAKLSLGQFPIAVGGVVVATNLEGIGSGKLTLNAALLGDIFLGRVSRWSDPAIRAQNPGLALPHSLITVVRRADGSGTSFTFTDYLSKAHPDWKQKVGAGLLVTWPVGVAAKANKGVAQAVRTTRGAIGYVDYAHALEHKLSYAMLVDRTGKPVNPAPSSFQVAASSIAWAPDRDFHAIATHAHGAGAYPITATAFVLLHKQAARLRSAAVLDFFAWSHGHGANSATQLGYVPIPAALSKQVRAYWSKSFGIKP
jgi:phosphate transport system substrate-binding protein